MADQERRGLQRALFADGDEHTQRAWIADRLRNRTLDEWRVRLAADLDHRPSLAILGRSGSEGVDIRAVLRGLEIDHGPLRFAVQRRFALRLARRASSLLPDGSSRVALALEALEGWTRGDRPVHHVLDTAHEAMQEVDALEVLAAEAALAGDEAEHRSAAKATAARCIGLATRFSVARAAQAGVDAFTQLGEAHAQEEHRDQARDLVCVLLMEDLALPENALACSPEARQASVSARPDGGIGSVIEATGHVTMRVSAEAVGRRVVSSPRSDESRPS